MSLTIQKDENQDKLTWSLEVLHRVKSKMDRGEELTPEEKAEFEQVVTEVILPLIENLVKIISELAMQVVKWFQDWWNALPKEVREMMTSLTEAERGKLHGRISGDHIELIQHGQPAIGRTRYTNFDNIDVPLDIVPTNIADQITQKAQRLGERGYRG